MSLDVVKRYDELYTSDAPMKAKTSHEQALLDLAREIRLCNDAQDALNEYRAWCDKQDALVEALHVAISMMETTPAADEVGSDWWAYIHHTRELLKEHETGTRRPAHPPVEGDGSAERRADEMERDAGRYRWLRDNSTRMSEPLVIYGQEHLGPVNDEHQCIFQFRAPLIPDFCANPDAAIDEARKHAQEGG